MTAREIFDQLSEIASAPDFVERTALLVDDWSAAGIGPEAIEPILRFMEQHAVLDFGTPGALTHFVERYHGAGLVSQLQASIARRPTAHTVWMLNRMINGATSDDERRTLVEAMRSVAAHPMADPEARQQAAHFLARLA